MSAPAGITDEAIRAAATAFRSTKADNYTLTAFDVAEKLKTLYGSAAFDSLTTDEMNRVSRIFENAFMNRPAGTGGKRKKGQTAKFNRCVKSVQKTVKARKGSTKESAAIGICVKTVLHKRGRTLKRYSKKRLVTQKRK
jgi:hypothetical protein